MAGAPKNTKKGSTTGEDVPRPSQPPQRMGSLSSSQGSRSLGSQSLSKLCRPSGVPSLQNFKTRKVISFWFFPQIIKFSIY